MMEVKIIKLVTGEQLISHFTNLTDENGNEVGFKLIFPFLVMTVPQQNGNDISFDVNYIAWMGASSDIEFAIPYSSVIAFGTPADEVKQMYLERFEEFKSYNNNGN